MESRGSSKLLAPGFRFHPTDEELVRYYLRRKIYGRTFKSDLISEIDIYKVEPWDLPGMSRLKTRDLEWYFFSVLDKKYGNGARTNRATEKGYWKTTGKDRAVHRNKSQVVGMKKTLVYHSGRAPKGQRTNWVMHEYRLIDEALDKAGIPQDAFVLCRVFQKSGAGPKNGEQYGAPFIEEEWEDDELQVPSKDETTEDFVFGDDIYFDANELDQILGTDKAVAGASFPSDYSYGENGSTEETNNSSDAQQPDELKPIDLAVQKNFNAEQVNHEYIGESSKNMNSEDGDYLLNEPIVNGTDDLQFNDEAFLEANDLSNPVQADSSGFDMLEEYLTYFDANDDFQNMSFDPSVFFGNDDQISDQALLPQKDVGEVTQQPIAPNEGFSEDKNGIASSSKLVPTKFESDYQYPFIKQASQMLGNIHAPPAFASEFPQFFNIFSLFLFMSFLFLLNKWKNSNSKSKRLPPGPWKLPLIGSMFHLLGGLPHHVFRDLAKKYGPIMHLQLGEVSLVVVTSADMAKQVLKTHDLAFAFRPKLLVGEILFYKGTDIVFSPYGDYWRQMRKICLLEFLSAKNVKSFNSIRQDEVHHMIEFFRSSSGETINVTKRIYQFSSSMTCRSVFGKVFKEQNKLMELAKEASRFLKGFDVADIFPSLKFLHVLCGMKGKIMDAHHELDAILENIINEHKNNGELGGEGLLVALLSLMKEGGLQFPITNDNIKAIIFDMFAGGTDTSSTLIDWAMVEMMKNPSVLLKAQDEIRNAFTGKETFNENDVEELKYLKLVVKETFRLHPPAPLLVARECREEVDIDGYNIPLKTKVLVNAYAIGRDPKYWIDAECFKPERFEQISVDFIGNNFEFLPFGSGRRICPGISFGLANIFFPLAKLLYHFDWKLPIGINPSDLDLTESAGIACARKSNLYLIATPHEPSQE